MEIRYKYLKNEAYKTAVETTLSQLESSQPTFSIKTSGSTGIPKNIVLHKKHMVASAEATIEFLKIPKGSKALLCLPADKIAGAMMLTRAIVGGWELTAVEPSSTPLVMLQDELFHFSAMVPLQVSKSLLQLNQIEKLIIGGGAIDDNLTAQLQYKSTKCWHTFGMTETISHVAMRSLNPSLEMKFRGIDGVRFSVDESQRLIINAKHIGVTNLLTNDVVQLENSTSFEWLGRYDNVVNSGGIKLFPEELEKKIKLNENFFLAGIPNQELGEKLILVIEAEKPIDPRILESATLNLGKFEKPKRVIYLPEFKYTSNGKLKRKEMLELIS